MKNYLKSEFIEFWNSLVENGEVKWNVDEEGLKIPNQVPSTVQLGRYIWFYSRFAKEFNDNKALITANDIYMKTKKDYMIEETGAYIISKETKNYHLYFNSFMLYGMSELYIANNDTEIKRDIDRLAEFIQTNFYDSELNMYKEELTLDMLDVEINSLETVPSGFDYTSNTIIHLLEAFTTVCSIDDTYVPVLKKIISILMTKFYNDEGHWAQYISRDGTKYVENISYGHDIETVWLVIEALNVIGMPVEKYKVQLLKIVKNVDDNAYYENGFVKGEKVGNTSAWWVFAESILGFYYAEKYLGYENKNYLKIWKYTKENIIDETAWCGLIDMEGKKIKYPYASPWKTPYHDGRMLVKMYNIIEGNK